MSRAFYPVEVFLSYALNLEITKQRVRDHLAYINEAIIGFAIDHALLTSAQNFLQPHRPPIFFVANN